MMDRRRELIGKLYDHLLHVFGHQHWWPAKSPFEVVVGAILTQNTSWKNVEQAIEVLRRYGLLTVESLNAVGQTELAAFIRSSGYYNQKAKKLKAFCTHVTENWQGDLNRFLSQDMEAMREELLSMHGIGPETADSIVLYAAHQLSFVVDVYTYRIFSRHGWIEENVTYDDMRSFFMDCLEPDLSMFQEMHALLVRTGNLHCRRKPICSGCPLEGWSSSMW